MEKNKKSMGADKFSIGYCGLYCGDCVTYKGDIADLARDLRKKFKFLEGKRYW